MLDRPRQGFTQWLAGPLAGATAEALERLDDGRLEPIVLPRGCTTWRDFDPALRDGNKEFLWRIICFSEWTKHARDG